MKERWKLFCNLFIQAPPLIGRRFLYYFKTITMTRKLSKRHFWKWFERNNNEYLQLGKKSKKEINYWLNELNAHLRAYFKFFAFTLSSSQDGTNGTLAISVGGNARRFKRVDALVVAAPAIANWKILALDEPMPIDFLLEEQYGDTGIDPHEFRFALEETDNLPRVVVYHPLYTQERQWIFEQVAEAAVYNLLGERSFGLDIGYMDADNLSCAPEDAELVKPEELSVYLGSRKSSWIVDASGRIGDGRNVIL
jgi:hypothetical protein